ncbi:HD domain-containing phosphohydrolase [Gordonia mangrovi]|nr:HD domain-containing phosphohydrolase [Gordonia mangrovi]UVF79157.1 LuxR C-terminal-related transcriptional regulator [Gordonia mangrovi]
MRARLADLLVGLSRFADLGFGLDGGTAATSGVLAARLARELNLESSEASACFYVALLTHVGCVGYASETARLFGDELAANAAAAHADHASVTDTVATFVPMLARGRSPITRVRVALRLLTRGSSWGEAYTTAACEVGRDAARRMQLPETVQTGMLHVYDEWRHGGDDIPISARVARLAGIAAVFSADGSPASGALRRRAGGMLDPMLVEAFVRAGLAVEPDADLRDTVLDAEPDPVVWTDDLVCVAEVFADLADLKSPSFLGHSRAVAALSLSAASRAGLSAADRRDLHLAGLLHDVGRVAISSAVWEKQTPLITDEIEQVRLHPYYSERIVAGSAELTHLAPLVGRHHERLDGTGYPHGCTAVDLTMPMRILAAADAYQTLREPRPHRPALPPSAAERAVLDRAAAGALDLDAVRAVVGGDVAIPTRAVPVPAGLTAREIEVLRLVAHGCSNAEIGARLVISRRTAEHHVQHIYTKIGVSSRAAATLFAVENQLLTSSGADG